MTAGWAPTESGSKVMVAGGARERHWRILKNGANRVVVIEQNHGAQLYHYLRGQLDFTRPLHSYAVAGPVPLNAGKIANYVSEVTAT